MSQTKTGSLMESLTNIAVGMGVSAVANVIIFNLYGIPLNAHRLVGITAWFTAVSIVRSYCLRRVFNKLKIWRVAD